MSGYYLSIKSIIDRLGSGILLLLFSWLLLIIGILYCITSEFPFFFKQKRIGKNNTPFTMWKFRTLSPHEDKSIQERHFALGDFLRSTNLDELPQLWNVLKGDMSLIGPRPLPMEYLNLFSKEQLKRHIIRPGLTGWAQVNGRHSISWQKKFDYDLYYVDHISFKFDMLIFFKTIRLLLSFRSDTSLMEEKFKGN